MGCGASNLSVDKCQVLEDAINKTDKKSKETRSSRHWLGPDDTTTDRANLTGDFGDDLEKVADSSSQRTGDDSQSNLQHDNVTGHRQSVAVGNSEIMLVPVVNGDEEDAGDGVSADADVDVGDIEDDQDNCNYQSQSRVQFLMMTAEPSKAGVLASLIDRSISPECPEAIRQLLLQNLAHCRLPSPPPPVQEEHDYFLPPLSHPEMTATTTRDLPTEDSSSTFIDTRSMSPPFNLISSRRIINRMTPESLLRPSEESRDIELFSNDSLSSTNPLHGIGGTGDDNASHMLPN